MKRLSLSGIMNGLLVVGFLVACQPDLESDIEKRQAEFARLESLTVFRRADKDSALSYRNYQKQQITCLAQNIYFESRGEPEKGQIAVGNVTMNRVKSKYFPNTVCEVVWEPKQFSWTHTVKDPTPENQQKYNDIYNIAERVYNGSLKDITKGSTFYHATTVDPSWNKYMNETMKIGLHVFYQTKGR